MASCSVCSNKIDRTDCTKMECCLCRKIFHAICIGMLPDDVEYFKKAKISWKCTGCVNLRKSMPHSSPPLSPIIRSANSVDVEIDDNDKDSFPFESNINSESLEFRLLSVTKAIDEAKSVLFSKFKVIEDTLQVTINELRSENKKLKSEIKSLNNRVEYLEQLPLNNSIDILGLPINNDLNELRISIFNLFCETLKTDIKEDNISSFYQKPIMNKTSNPVKYDNVICVKFNSSVSKDTIIKAKKKLKNNPIVVKNEKNEESYVDCFINHSMTFNNRKLYKAAYDIQKEFKVKYLWFRNGKILMRKQDGSDIRVINDLMDLDCFKS